MLYIKCNSSIPRVLNAEIGYLKEWNNSRSATYVLISPFKGTIAFGGLSLYSQKLSFAFVGNANIKKKKIDLEAGVKISTETDLRAKINQNGDIELFSKFKPRDWLTVTLRSEAPLNVSSWPVSFGWSLQFCK